MGAFFTNVQVLADGADSIARLTEAIDELGADEGYERADGRAADREIVLLPPDAGGWIAIYDQRTESQEVGPLLDLLEVASGALGTSAVSVLVHDSDVLQLSLADEGLLEDTFDSDPEYFGSGSTADPPRPERWRKTLREDASPESLAALFEGERALFAEATLRECADLLGLDARRASVGHRYLEDFPELSKGATRLHYRLTERPEWETPPAGLSRLEPHAIAPEELTLAVGDELRVGLSTKNAGGAGRGLTAMAFGAAIDAGLVAVDRFELLVGSVREGAKHEMSAPAETKSTDGKRLQVMDRPEQAIPAGVTLSPGALAGGDAMSVMAAMLRATLHVNVVGRVVTAGEGELGVAFRLHENDEGGLAQSTRLRVTEPLPRPLRSPPGTPSHLLRQLIGDRYVIALVVLDSKRARSAPRVLEAFERLRAIVRPGGQAMLSMFHGRERRPTALSGELGELLEKAPDLSRSLREDRRVSLYCGVPQHPGRGEAHAMQGEVGFSFGSAVIDRQEEPDVDTLCLWARHEPGSVDALREVLLDATAALLEVGGIQGVVARTAWVPGIDATVYEAAARGHASGATRRAWVTRWLRYPGNDTLFIGPSLRARLDDEADRALGEIAELRQEGSMLRVTLSARDDAPALERALAAILPGPEDPVRTA